MLCKPPPLNLQRFVFICIVYFRIGNACCFAFCKRTLVETCTSSSLAHSTCKFMYFLLCLGSRFEAFIQPSCLSGRLPASHIVLFDSTQPHTLKQTRCVCVNVFVSLFVCVFAAGQFVWLFCVLLFAFVCNGCCLFCITGQAHSFARCPAHSLAHRFFHSCLFALTRCCIFSVGMYIFMCVCVLAAF